MSMGDEVWRLFPDLTRNQVVCEGRELLAGLSDSNLTGQLLW